MGVSRPAAAVPASSPGGGLKGPTGRTGRRSSPSGCRCRSEGRYRENRSAFPTSGPRWRPPTGELAGPCGASSRWQNPRGVRPAIHPGQTACDETRAAFGRRSIPADRVAARRSSLRFGRNTPGIPPSRALSARRLTGLGAHPGSTTGCSPLRFAAFGVAFRSKYTGYSSLTRLVSRAPHRPRRSRGFHHRLLGGHLGRVRFFRWQIVARSGRNTNPFPLIRRLNPDSGSGVGGQATADLTKPLQTSCFPTATTPPPWM